MGNRIGYSEARIAAYGQWDRIAPACGVALATISHQKHQPCPGCGGKDRFRLGKNFNDYGNWLCSGGGDFQSGDGFALLSHVHGWSAAESLAAVKEVLGLTADSTPEQRQALAAKAEAHAEKISKRACAADERHWLDNNLMHWGDELHSYVKFRQRCQRLAGKPLAPVQEEVEVGRRVYRALMASYGGANHGRS